MFDGAMVHLFWAVLFAFAAGGCVYAAIRESRFGWCIVLSMACGINVVAAIGQFVEYIFTK